MPTENGTVLHAGRQPEDDSTAVERLRQAGAIILGKTVTTELAVYSPGKTKNPHDPTRTSGGSSSGSAALVAAGEVDLAIGCDQGGSIRIPSSYCGIVGMKPTHGLVPYTGIIGMDATIDHVGPMTADVTDNAMLLAVIAGADGIDGRQVAPRTDDYMAALGRGCQRVRVAFVLAALGRPGLSAPATARIDLGAISISGRFVFERLMLRAFFFLGRCDMRGEPKTV